MLNIFNHITSNYPLLLLLPVCVDPIHNTILTLTSLYLMCFNVFYPRGQKKDAYIARVSLSLTQKMFLGNFLKFWLRIIYSRMMQTHSIEWSTTILESISEFLYSNSVCSTAI